MGWIVRAAASGFVAYAMPRIAIAAGIPIDEWLVAMGQILGASVDREIAIWVITLIFGVLLFGVESWRHPFQRLWALAFRRDAARGAPLPRPDWLPLDEVFGWIHNNTQVSDHYDILRYAAMVRQAAAAGNINIRGYQEINRNGPGDRFDNIRTVINADYWRTHDFDITALGGVNRHQPETVVYGDGDLPARKMPHYRGLQADMNQVKALWDI